jgi:hypothetical protein
MDFAKYIVTGLGLFVCIASAMIFYCGVHLAYLGWTGQ